MTVNKRLPVVYLDNEVWLDGLQARETERREQDMELILELKATNETLQDKLQMLEEKNTQKIGPPSNLTNVLTVVRVDTLL